jgi:hypothetical protein
MKKLISHNYYQHQIVLQEIYHKLLLIVMMINILLWSGGEG